MPMIHIDSPERVEYARKVISRLPLDFPGWDVRIERHVEHRTLKQNARLWKLHQLAAEHVGCGAQEMHDDMLCEHFGAVEVTMPSGAIRRIPVKRSSQRNVKEFAAFMEFVESFYIRQLGVFLGDE